jgi:hypothetical protein
VFVGAGEEPGSEYQIVMNCLRLRGKGGAIGGFAREGGRGSGRGAVHPRPGKRMISSCLPHTDTPPSPYIERVPLMGCRGPLGP